MIFRPLHARFGSPSLWFSFAFFALVLVHFGSPFLWFSFSWCQLPSRKTQFLLFETTTDVLWDRTWAADHISDWQTSSASGWLMTFRNFMLNLKKASEWCCIHDSYTTWLLHKIRTAVSGYISVGRRGKRAFNTCNTSTKPWKWIVM